MSKECSEKVVAVDVEYSLDQGGAKQMLIKNQISHCSSDSSSSSSSSSSGRSSSKNWSRCAIFFSLIIAAAALLLLCLAYFFIFFKQADTVSASPIIYGTFAIDLAQTRNCHKNLGHSELPCKQRNEFVTDDDKVGPLRCIEDKWESNVTCRQSSFAIDADGKGIVIPQSGVYDVQAIATFYDSIPRYVSASLRIDRHTAPQCRGSHVCETRKRQQAHTWLSCFNRNRHAAGSRDRPDFAQCVMTGVRRFTAGDVLSLYIHEKYRSLNAFYKASYLVVKKL